MKSVLKFVMFMMAAPFLCGVAFLMGYVILVALTIPQLPVWAQPGVTEWLLDIPQPVDSEIGDNGTYGDSAPAGQGRVEWSDYVGPDGVIRGLPLWGPIRHWSNWHDKPLLGCLFHDPFYSNHTGADFPVYPGTPIHATMGGEVVWADYNGPWGNLVVIQNGDYQVWLAHLDAIHVVPGQIVGYDDVIGLSGNTGNSSGPHLHYGIKQRTGEDTYVWLNPQLFFDLNDVINFGCSD
jgi:murein DD-endopeptidase MepM/ murein hydrolase activator NlpD